ncbi:shieldin complex subunit 1 [Cuculus canorus]|uniref:shieldin complex subunit 1 n=1 Tax=Cuculus canorus TaxID=55661 RepID=UPI0023AA412E|nr:shieldin complex subunit 1 [Cuculus canorus]
MRPVPAGEEERPAGRGTVILCPTISTAGQLWDHGRKETSPSRHSEESSILDLPSVCDLAECFLPPHSSENSEELFRSVDIFPSTPTGENNLHSAVPVSISAGGSEKANVICYAKGGLSAPTEPNDTALSWMYEHDSAEDTRVRKSLDGFYKMYCKKQPDRMDPTYEAASQCLSQKISELANQDGTKYVSRCLQMAQVVLNRDGCKIFPNHPTTACFSKPAEGEDVLQVRKRIPGLSDDVLKFLLKQTRTEYSFDVPHKK